MEPQHEFGVTLVAGGSWSLARFAAVAEEGLPSGNDGAWGLHLQWGGCSLALDASSLLLERTFETLIQ